MVESTTVGSSARRPRFNLSDQPVARRFFAVIVAALLMGVVFGSLWVASAESSASQFSRVSKLATLDEAIIVCVNDLQNERDTALLLSPTVTSSDKQQTTMGPFFSATNAGVKAVRQAAAGIGAVPGNIQGDLSAVLVDLSPGRVKELHENVSSAQDDLAITDSYGSAISDLITLADQAGQGVSDGELTGDVQALNALALAKEQVSQQRALLNSALSAPVKLRVTYDHNGGTAASPLIDTANPGTEQSLALAYDLETADLNVFFPAVGQLQALDDVNEVNWPAGAAATNIAQDIEQNVIADDDDDYFINNGATDTHKSVPGSQLIPSLAGVPLLKLKEPTTTLSRGLATWDLGMGDDLTAMQSAEKVIADDIVSRAGQLHHSAQQSALTFGLITIGVLLLVLLAGLVVARSLVRPLRRLRAGALDIASVQLPERVRLLTESPDAAASMEVAPINVVSGDEIGEVARAFDQVHAEAVRLAGEQTLLRSSFNAMFVNLSRRSQSLIERLARMIDNLEQSEDDPDRLGGLFSMDHLVTRMRRNSENLLLLAGHDSPRKWTEPVPLADVARAASSEIEQYNRVTVTIAPGIAVVGAAVSDVAHLLAELIENATIFSSKDTQVQVSMQELSSGGVLIEVSDKGIGVSEARLADMNWRLDNPPTVDVSVSRHMGLFAVARLAERHRIRVRLRPASPQGLSALVWLPDSVVERTSVYGGVRDWQSLGAGAGTGAQPIGAQPIAARRQLGGAVEGAVAVAPNGHENGAGFGNAYGNGNGNGSGFGHGALGNAAGLGNGNGSGFGHGALGNGSGLGNGNGNGQDQDTRTAQGFFRGPDGGSQEPGSPPSWTADHGQQPEAQTSAGLPVRARKATLGPDAGAGNPTGGLPQRSLSGRGGPPPRSGSATGVQPLPQRSPDQVRNRLSGFQRGARRAETQTGQSPRAGEGSER
ncbi:MAG TPA: nitrate- and nitrite sensing domain-containing protein [Trebonia sp.]|jgi:signal transduction histidine kinase|nr:nitrate- and nitrite sensing domain-containing protein [Trebonia sp.]